MPGYARPPSYQSTGISVNPSGQMSSDMLQDALEELDEDIVYQESPPGSPSIGSIWISSANNVTFIWNGTEWKAIASPGLGGYPDLISFILQGA